MTLEEALRGKEIPPEIRATLALVEVEHFGFDRAVHSGQLVVDQALAGEVREIFAELLALEFPIEKVIPIVAYGWSDDASMADNNTSAFNYRTIAGTSQLSNHATGRAIDLNPARNPYERGDLVLPPGATYDPARAGTVAGPVVEIWKRRGWSWGGDWGDRKDYQHFEKHVPELP